MSSQGVRYDAAFKAKVALEALKEDKTIAQIASEYQVSPRMVQIWKQELLNQAALIMDKNKVAREYEKKIEALSKENERLKKALGTAVIERDWLKEKLKGWVSSEDRLRMIEIQPDKCSLSVRKQAELLEVTRTLVYYKKRSPRGTSSDYELCREIERVYEDYPYFGYRRISAFLIKQGVLAATASRVRRLMRKMLLVAIYPRSRKITSVRNSYARRYPNLIQNLVITGVGQVWVSDITYIATGSGFYYLAIVMDLYSRMILGFGLSNTLDSYLLKEAMDQALAHNPPPMIFHSDQGSQYTSKEHLERLQKLGVMISMTGKGRSTDNAYAERFFRSYKYEKIYIDKPQSVTELRKLTQEYIHHYNHLRPHQGINYEVPMERYFQNQQAVLI